MKYEYDKLRCLELLKEDERLKKKGMSLYTEDKEKFLELLKYEVRLEEQKFWENRKKYFSIMTNLINEKLTVEDFNDMFMVLWENDRDRVTVNYDPNIESKEFTRWTNKIFSYCEFFEPEAEEYEEYGEKWLKDGVSNILIQMQKEYN